MVGCAGQMQARMPGGDAFNFCNALAVANVILGIRLRPTIGFGQHRLGVDAHDGAKFFASQLNEGSVILLRQEFCAGAADEDANQFELFRCAMGKLL